jgi:1-acyl-sn-glycerol-3-phosphate acyltransferase
MSTVSLPIQPASPRPTRAGRRDADLHLRLFPRLLYRACRGFGKFIWFCTIRAEIIRPELAERPDGYLIACSHFSHLEPFLLGFLLRRKIDWMSRVEFFCYRWTTWFLLRFGAFPVNRQGVPVSAIRTSLARIRQGRVVGICPEGGVTIGKESVCRGGPIKRGVCLISHRTGAPIIPCVMIGTHTLNRVEPWLPFRRARLWIAFGNPVMPDATAPTRQAARAAMATELQQQFVALYEELRQRYGIDDAFVP